ncbi:MBL fold metallo-hydrolase [Kineococcus sp. SYSU DK001]|uniref:MBL fold metallo-hydrolase n=1 Tax=Kineococcus sp. SYSU DK001 TaxID=3383122 RepID=UPI003D7C725E
MRVTHFGHSCLLVETAAARVLLDPGVFSHGFEELQDLDAVVITHAHPDHVDVERLESLLEANDGAQLRAEPATAASLTESGIGARPLHPGEHVELAGVRIEAAGGRHAVIHADIPRIGNVGVLLSAEGEPTLFHPGDSYETVPAGVDVLAVPIAAPWAALKETVEFVRAAGAATGLVIHEGVLSAPGRAVYGNQVRTLGGLDLREPQGTTPLEF